MKKTILKIFVSLALFAFLSTQVNFEQVYSNFLLLDATYIPLIIGFLILNYLISSVRWKRLIIFKDAPKASIPFLARLYFIGAFFNNFMPTSIGGDVYKVYRLGKKIGSNAYAFSATFMERFTGMVALVLISYVGFFKTWDFWLEIVPESISENSSLVFGLRILLFFGFWIGAALAIFSLGILSKRFAKLQRVYDSIISYATKYSVLTWAFLTSFLVQFLAIFTQYFIFLALGVELDFFYALFVLPLITLVSFVVPSLNGIGVQDALYVKFFGIVGIDPVVSVSASLIYHFFRLLVSLIGGVLYALERGDSSVNN